MKQINFYHQDAPFGCFSNFSSHQVLIDGKIWSTTEHYFQAMKFLSEKEQEWVRNLATPMEAKKYGQTSPNLRKDWEKVKIQIMKKALLAKFDQHIDFKAVLSSTGSDLIVEHTANDKFWGDGGNGLGLNMLGRLLMEIRSEKFNH